MEKKDVTINLAHTGNWHVVAAEYIDDSVHIYDKEGDLIAELSPLSAVMLAEQLRKASLDALSALSQAVGDRV